MSYGLPFYSCSSIEQYNNTCPQITYDYVAKLNIEKSINSNIFFQGYKHKQATLLVYRRVDHLISTTVEEYLNKFIEDNKNEN